MKGGIAAAAVAVLASGAQAANPHHRRAHDLLRRGHEVCVPSCTTIWTTYYGEPTLVPNPPPPAPKTTKVKEPVPTKEVTSAAPETTSEVAETTTTEAPKPTSTKVVVVVPTPEEYNCPTPGTYTFPATTITVTESTTLCVGESTKVPSGTHVVGGVTTIVEEATTVTCPYAKETTSDGVVTSVIETTVYVCPTAGTYTIAPITKSCTEETVLVYPVPTSYAPGTYTAPQKVVTVTESDYVYVCPYTQEGVPAPSKAPKAPKEKKPQTPTYDEPETETPAYEEPSEIPKPKAKLAKPQPKKQPTSGGALRGSNDHYGITYTPYDSSNGECKGREQVYQDIKTLKDAGFGIIRSYSTDCDTLENVGGACKEYGMDMMIGVFVKRVGGCTYETAEIKEQVDAIAKWKQWDQVKLFVVGNEAIMNNFCTPEQLSTLIEVVKSKCSGYNGPYTTAETLNIWQRKEVQSSLCGVIDVTGANIHPYFNHETTPSKAGEFVQGQLDILAEICQGHEVINLECGWPTRGKCNGVACPGKEEQREAIESIRSTCGDKTVFFSYEDDMWKKPGDCGCEQSWGSKNVF